LDSERGAFTISLKLLLYKMLFW